MPFGIDFEKAGTNLIYISSFLELFAVWHEGSPENKKEKSFPVGTVGVVDQLSFCPGIIFLL